MRAEPLTPEAFKPFGQVVGTGFAKGSEANQGTALRFDFAAQLVNLRTHARANLCAVRAQPQALPLKVKLLERHPHSSQAFLPMQCSRLLIVVAPTAADGSPDLKGLRAFIGRPGQGINYAPGVWHHPMAVLDTPAELAMLVWEDGSKGDCEERPLAAPVTIEADPSP